MLRSVLYNLLQKLDCPKYQFCMYCLRCGYITPKPSNVSTSYDYWYHHEQFCPSCDAPTCYGMLTDSHSVRYRANMQIVRGMYSLTGMRGWWIPNWYEWTCCGTKAHYKVDQFYAEKYDDPILPAEPTSLKGIEDLTKDKLEQIYLRLVKYAHPDGGGTSEAFRFLRWAFEVALRNLNK